MKRQSKTRKTPRPRQPQEPRAREFDSSWKIVLEKHFWECLDFYFPHIAGQIDKTKGYKFLDQELQKIVPRARSQKRRLDKLASVCLQDGAELWVLIHLEVQTYRDKKFAQRMFSYYYRIWDKYQRKIASLAILADNSSKFKPKSFELSLFGKRYVYFEFEVAKLRDWEDREQELQQTSNIFGLVTLASLKAFEQDMTTRAQWKLLLTTMLYDRGYSEEAVLELYQFLDGIMVLPDDLEIAYNDKITQIEEDKHMPYVTTAERIGIQKGRQEGEQIGIQKGRQEGEQIGIQKGEQIGIQKGEQIGIQKGEQIGIQKGKSESVLNALKLGLDVDTICKITGMSKDDIRKLQKQGKGR